MRSIVKSIAMLDMNSRMEYFQIILFTLLYIGIHGAFSEKILDVEITPKKVIVAPSYEDPIVLRCTIKSSANMSDGEDLKSYWTKNGVPITERLVNTTIFDDAKFAAPYLLENDTLFIGRLTPEKEGTYACTARIRTFSEIVSEERSTAPVYFAKVNEFSFVSPDTEVEEGSFATLTCVSGFSIPSANLSWIKAGGGKIAGVQSQYILRHDKETGMYMTSSSIQFSNISTYDQGEYSCVAVNRLLPSLTKVSRRIFLRVKEKPAAPQIILQPESVYAVNDQSSKFVCISSGTPTPKITWYYNNVNIDAGQSPVQDAISIDSYGHTSILAISSSTPEVTGEYKCLAKNEFGHAMSNAAELQIAAFSWIFEQEPENTEIYINKAATLICRPPSSQPPASVTWYKDNKVLDLTRTPSVRKLSSGDLYLEEAKLEHSGEYFCQASNRLLDVTATSQRAQVTVFAPPTVTQLPITADVVLEHTIKLECNVTGYPFPDVKWTKNGLTLATNERIILGLRNQTLFITSAMTEDEAFYSCTARNEHGRIDSGPTLLKVLVPPVIHTKVPDNVLIDLGVPYTISCKAIGTPEPKYKWTKDGRFLNVPAESRLTLVNNGLKISEVLESDTGRYNCTAYNKVTEVWSDGLIRVKVPAQITSPPQSGAVDEYGNINFTCIGRGYPDITYDWTVESTLRVNSTNATGLDHTIRYEDGETIMSLTNVSRNFHGSNFTCIAQNFWSKDVASAQLSVSTEPVVISLNSSHVSPISPTTNVTISCEVEGRPTPDIQWFYRVNTNVESTSLKSNDFVDFSRNIDSGTVNIFSIKERDEGYYSCRAKNSVGSSSREIFIEVLDPPDQITNFHLQTLSSTSIRVQWMSEDFVSKGIKSFEITYGTNLDLIANTTTLNLQATKGTNEAIINGLKPDTSYIIQVTAVNDAGAGDRSFKHVAITYPGTPSEPTSIRIDNVTSSSFTVEWKEPEETNGEVVEYELEYRKISPGKYFPQTVIIIRSSNATVPSHSIFDLVPQSTYIVSLKAGTLGHNGTILWGEKSPHVSVKTHEAAPSSPPANIEAITKSQTSILIRWSEIPEESQHGEVIEYRIKYVDDLLNTSHEISVNGTYNSHLLKNLSPWCNYSINVLGLTSAGNGPWSNTIIMETFMSEPTSVVTGFTVNAVSNESVLFTWHLLNKSQENGPGIYYRVKLWETADENAEQEHESKENMLIVQNLRSWTSYTAKIRAQNDVNGTGAWSHEIYFKTNESVSGPCVNLHSFDNTWESISIKWRPPAYVNGRLQGYVVQHHTIYCGQPGYVVDINTYTCVETTTQSATHSETKMPNLTNLLDYEEKLKPVDFIDMNRSERKIENVGNNFMNMISTAPYLVPFQSTTEDSAKQVIEGPVTEALLLLNNESEVTYNISSLESSTLYTIIVRAINKAGLGIPSKINAKTVSAPTTTPSSTTTNEATTVEDIATTTTLYRQTKASLTKSALIAGSTGGALFICLVIALMAITTCFKRRKDPANINKASSIISKHFEKSASSGNIELQNRDSIEVPEIPTFTGSIEETTPKESFESRTKYSLSHYKRYRSPSPDDTETEFEYAIIQDDSKAFADTLPKKNDNTESAVYAQFVGIPSPKSRHTRLQSSPNRSKPVHHPRKMTNATNVKSVIKNGGFPDHKPNWTLRSSVSCSSYDSVTSHSLKQARRAQQQHDASKHHSNSPTIFSDIDNIVIDSSEGKPKSISENRYSYGQHNTNNNRTELKDIPMVKKVRRYSIEDTYM